MKKLKSQRWARAMIAVALSSFHINTYADENISGELEPLGVVGTKEELKKLSPGLKSSLELKDIPRSISVMSSERIKAQGLKSVGDVIDYTPGVINSQGEGHRDAVVIRGKRTTQDFYKDGVRDDVQYYRPLYNVEKVEVLRGSDALTSGFGGAHGMVNRVSKKGVIGETFNVASASVDTFGETVFSLDSNYQLDEDKALRINMFGENLENHRDYYYGDSFGVNPTLKMNFGGSTLDLSYEYLNQERFIDRGIPTGKDASLPNYLQPLESLKDYVFADPKENFSNHEAHIFKGVLQHEVTDRITGRFSASFSTHDKLYQCLYASNYDQNTQQVDLQGYVDTTQRDTGIFSYELTGEFQTGNIVHSLTAGVEYTAMNNDNDRYYADWYNKRNPGLYNGTSSALDTSLLYGSKDHSKATFNLSRQIVNNHSGILPDGNQTFNDYNMAPYDKYLGDLSVFSFYLQDEVSLTDSLDLVLGARFDNMDYDVDYARADQGTSRGDSDETISPKIGLIFDITDEASLYAAYSETFQQVTGDQYANIKKEWYKDVDPISHETTEFGLRYNFPIGLSLSAAYFNVESHKPNQVAAGVYNMIESELDGYEIELTGSLTNRWFISAGYTSLDAKDSSGNRIQEAPENVFSIWNNFIVTDRLAANLGIIYQDSSIIDNDDPDPQAYLPDYTRVDAGVAYALSESTNIQLNIENLLDEVYFPSAHDTHQATVGAPINAMLSITSKF